jgi:hemerythrin-like domain-containing protein
MATDDTTALPPQLNGVLLVHATLRRQAAGLRAATEHFGDTSNDPAALVRLWSLFSRNLHRHHQGEDDVIYPLVLSRQPDFADIHAEMHAEHGAIVDVLERADAAFDQFRSDPTTGNARHAHAVVGEVQHVLTEHLAHEESAALPIVASLISEDEIAGFEKRFVSEIPSRERGLSLAAMDASLADHPELHLPAVPKPVQALLALVWRRQYASLIRRAGV